ncbi:MAG: bifunctional adenosylcobinamide kinase/adenosylcobinamide-phosphate guanylyltransferase [Desulfovibrionaceae bacterium]|nr:bifunctional adenosylcobinamide kinase/adenosylcobinamide-phosphate guanylyltransferase [Desulfovibrionaceae bacterium]
MRATNLTLYVGGTRSGKSEQAEAAALRAGGPVLYVATAETRQNDASMLERIRRHRVRRPAHWRTLECPCRLAEAVAAALEQPPFARRAGGQEPGPTVLVDCVTLWMANILFRLPDPDNPALFEAAVHAEVEALLAVAERSACRWLLVSGEVGLGGTAPDAVSRHYADGLGLANQLIAARAGDVFLVVAGRLLRLEKG